MPDRRLRPADQVVDVFVAVSGMTVRMGLHGGRRLYGATRPFGNGISGAAQVVPSGRRARAWLRDAAARGAADRAAVAEWFAGVLDHLVPVVVRELLDRVDLDAVVRRIDLDAAVRRVDLDAVVDRIDLTAVALERVDLDAIVGRVIDQLDLAALAQRALDAVDMPEVIRGSSGAMASDAVREVRMQGVAGDQAVRRAVDRLLGHRPPPVRAPG